MPVLPFSCSRLTVVLTLRNRRKCTVTVSPFISIMYLQLKTIKIEVRADTVEDLAAELVILPLHCVDPDHAPLSLEVVILMILL